MTYSTDIDTLSPDHRWEFDGDVLDSVSTADCTNVGLVLTDAGICVDATNCITSNGTSDRATLPTVTDINGTVTRKIMAGWFLTTAINTPPKRIYGEGNNSTCFQIVMAYGNNMMLECVEPTNFVLQVYGIPAVPNRAYHLCGVFEGSGFGNEVKFYIDGVEQLLATPTNRQPNSTDLNSRGVGQFADPSGTVGVGGDVVILNAPLNGKYNQWASWSGVSLTTTQIRETLFEKGAIPETTITNQAGLDSLASTVRGDSPLAILVNVSGSISLTADNVTFNPLCSIHVQYNGTGVLTWINTNGSDASIGSTTSTGSIVFENPATLTINGILNGAEVRIYDDEIADNGSMDTELDGIESNSGTSFVFNHSGVSNTVIIQMMADGYVEVIKSVVLSPNNQTVTLFPVVETND